MLHAALTVLAAEAEETSKTAFYVMGAVLAGFAVVLAAFGLRQVDWPSSATAQRGTIALTVVLVAATMATVLITA